MDVRELKSVTVIGIVTDLDETLADIGAEKGDLYIILEDNEDNRRFQAELMLSTLKAD